MGNSGGSFCSRLVPTAKGRICGKYLSFLSWDRLGWERSPAAPQVFTVSLRDRIVNTPKTPEMIYIDARKAADYGIGTYIRHVLPGVLERFSRGSSGQSVTVLVNEASPVFQVPLCDRVGVRVMRCRPFGVGEQLEYMSFIRPTDFFWATSLSHPLMLEKNVVASVHDVAQLDIDPITVKDRALRPVFWMFLRSISLKSRGLLFNSEFTRSRFMSFFPGFQGLATVTHLGPGLTPPISRQPLVEKHEYFLLVGNMRPHKNIPFLLNAFLRNRSLAGYRLKIIGSTNLPEPARSAALRSPGRIECLGYVSDGDLAEAMTHASGLFFPSLYEGFGLPALEAMCFGCPVIAADNSAIPEVCGDLGFYFDPRDERSFDEAVTRFFGFSADAKTSLVHALVERSGAFSWDECAEKTFGLVRRAFDR